MQVRKIQSLGVQDRNPTRLRKRRKPLLEQCIDFSINGGAALLVAASLKRLQDERAAELISSTNEDDEHAGGTGGGGGGLGASGAGSGGNGGSGRGSGAGGGQDAQTVPSGFTLDQLHRELQELLDIKVCWGVKFGWAARVEGAGSGSLRLVCGSRCVFWGWRWRRDFVFSLFGKTRALCVSGRVVSCPGRRSVSTVSPWS